MADEAAPSSIADRIAALKLSQVGRIPGQPPPSYNEAVNNAPTNALPSRPRPPPPPRPNLPARPNRAQSSNVPTVQDHAPAANRGIGNLPEQGSSEIDASNVTTRPPLPARTSTQSSIASQNPALPPRRASGQPSPALPPRRPSEAPSQFEFQRSRRGSNESVSSIATARSSLSVVSTSTSLTSQSDRYRIRAPEYDPAALPALPPNKTKEEKEADARKYAGLRPLRQTKSTPKVAQANQGTTPPPSKQIISPPPVLPGRPSQNQSQAQTQAQMPEQPERPARTQPVPPPRPRQSALSYGMNQSTNRPPPPPNARPESVPQTDDAPPPLPTASKPDLTALQASKPKFNSAASGAPSVGPAECLHCRDFSGPDNHATRFPRQAIPSSDIGWLAHQLTSPFPSATDKARAIFTWLHHNVEYDTVAFFNNNVKPSTPQSTLQTGLAVCEGYAGLFTALALKAGLESIVVGGHGKGYGHTAHQPGQPVPPYDPSGHAWNAVRIDNGEWKLLDACWGAGHVNGANQPYKKHFSPERFTQSNIDFGSDHFPQDSSKQFRTDGRVMGWEEYILGNKNGCGASFFSGYVAEEGLARTTFLPASGTIAMAQQGPTVRFAFQKICPHWDPVRCGRGPYYLYVLALGGLDGTNRNHVPFETNGDVWWCDVPVRDLGGPGKSAVIFTVNTFDNRDGRGLTIQEYRQRKGRVGMSFGGVCKWEVA